MRDDELRDLLAGYTAVPTPKAPTASELRKTSGRRRTLALGGGALGLATLGGAGLLTQTGRRATPLAPTPTPEPPVAATCADFAKAWTDALTTPAAFPASLGKHPAAVYLADGTLGAVSTSTNTSPPTATAVFPEGLGGRMVRLEHGTDWRVNAAAPLGLQVAFVLWKQGKEATDKSFMRFVVLDGPDATPREVTSAIPIEPGDDTTRTAYRITDGSLRWFETSGASTVLKVNELALDGSASAPTSRDVGSLSPAKLIVEVADLLAYQAADGTWKAVKLDDLTPATPPPGIQALDATSVNPNALLWSDPSGRYVTYGSGTADDDNWTVRRYDSATGLSTTLADGVEKAWAHGNLVLAATYHRLVTDEDHPAETDTRLHHTWRMTDTATGNSVVLALPEAFECFAFGETVVSNTWHLPQTRPGADGHLEFATDGYYDAAVFSIDSLPRTIPAC